METGYKIIDSAIDTGNYKLALKLIDKKIKETPHSSHCHACKYFVLAKMGLDGNPDANLDEVLQQCLALVKQTPSDSKTIKLLSTTLESLDYKLQEDLYEIAMRKYQSTNLAFEWFQDSVAKNDFISMQKATMALSKSFKVETTNGKMIKLWAAAAMKLKCGLLYDGTTKYLVDTGVDDWDTWKLAILSAKKLHRTQVITDLINNYKASRNSALAKMLVLDESDIKQREQAFKNYLGKYLSKLCCFLDLKSFIDEGYISKRSALAILEETKNSCISPELLENRRTTEKELNILVNYVKIKSRLSNEIFVSEFFFKECCDYYNATKHLQSKLSEFDYYAGFEFLVLAIQKYVTIDKSLGDQQTVLNLIVLIENELIKNKYEFHMQLWLAHLYLNTNMYEPLKRIFEALKIKNVQIDTLSSHFINHMASRTRSNELINKCLEFYTANVTAELPPMIMNCFEKQTFSKLQGFVEFKARIEKSITHYELLIEKIQHTRLNSNKIILDTIIVNYIPKLKEAYHTFCQDGKDVATKLHDNIDKKILSDCGDHRLHHEFLSFLNTALSRTYDLPYIKINILKELLIYDQHSRVWNDYRSAFSVLLNNPENLNSFSSIEKVFLQSFSNLLDSNSDVELDLNIVKPIDPIEANFNHYYLLLQDWDRILTTLKRRSSSQSFFGQKENLTRINYLQKILRSYIDGIDRDNITVTAKTQLKISKQKCLHFFLNDSFGKEFKVPVDVINKCYKNFEIDLLKNLREI
ncbi:hypothetical protein CANINC_002181 [Pichia inconspicua]|uniref:Uncharacterized protein n=1 Tax=Pichia inconspicua TaxID=52247 RepID=A0A4V4NFT5_9ASCO|nr:hypothetical protein CANINC_002181 [[Candida] inconspicua]